MTAAVRWEAFAAEAPALAEAGRALLYQYGVGLGYLATVRPDGGPRIHPVCPVVTDGGLWVFVAPTPKQHDLRRDPRYALHAFSPIDVDDELMVAGEAHPVDDVEQHRSVLDAYLAQGTISSGDETLFELLLDRALHARYETRPQWPPVYTRWRVG